MQPLPQLMVAPNGARRTKADHSQLPMTINETVETALACHEAGADAIHLHVRDADGSHTLDAGLYREAINELALKTEDLVVQITTEAVGQYTPSQQRKVVREVLPRYVSVSIAEMMTDELEAAADFYRWCTDESISVQHILYGNDDLHTLESMLERDKLSKSHLQLLFVLGKYSTNMTGEPSELAPFTQWLIQHDVQADWAVCAFGRNETRCLQTALEQGGKVRVGFENSFWNIDGSLARDNAERVVEIKTLVDAIRIEKHLSG